MAPTRRLAAIMFTDIYGYTRMMGDNEAIALDILDKNRAIHRDCISRHNGQYVKDIGDGALASFDSATDAVECAVSISKATQGYGYQLRMGIHEADTVFKDGDVFGDGVNIASRIEAAGIPGNVLFSAKVNDSLKNQPHLPTKRIGQYHFKNDVYPREIFALDLPHLMVPSASQIKAPMRSSEYSPGRMRQHNWVTMALITIALILIAIFASRPKETITGQIPTTEHILVVFPFTGNPSSSNVTGNQISTALGNKLGRLPGVIIINPTEVVRGQEILQLGFGGNAGEQAQRMRASHYITGHLDRKLTVSLHTTESTTPLLDKKYSFRNAVQLLQDIADDIADKLAIGTGAQIALIKPMGDEASQIYLDALEHWKNRTDTASLFRAMELLDIALELEENNPDIHGLKSLCYANAYDRSYYNNLDSAQLDSVKKEWMYHADYALRLNPRQVDALMAMGTWYQKQLDFNRARDYYDRALAAAPGNGIVHQGRGELALFCGDYNQALKLFLGAQKAVPFDETVNKHIMWGEMANGLTRSAYRRAQEHIITYKSPDTIQHRYFNYLIKDSIDAALALVRSIDNYEQGAMWVLLEGLALVEMGNREALDNYFERVDSLSYVGRHIKLISLLHTGDAAAKRRGRDQYKSWIANDRFHLTYMVQTYPLHSFNSFRSDPEVQSIARKYGITFVPHPYFILKKEFAE